jgi:hypothetical protein
MKKCRSCKKKLEGVVIVDVCLSCYQKQLKRAERVKNNLLKYKK